MPVFEDNLLAVCINTGALRKDEIKEVRASAKLIGVNLQVINASQDFIRALRTTSHSEVKRARFKKLYLKHLEQAAKNFGAEYIIQGSLATDIIESGKAGESALIKSHHNVGLNWSLKDLHPLRKLFKYEVRELARQLDLPPSITNRQPFPGPGLFVRIVGEPVSKEKLSIVRWADNLVTDIFKKYDIYDSVSQLITALLCIKTVGIKGDHRSYGYSIVVRGFVTSDFMTGQGFQIPQHIRKEITVQVTKHPKIVRVYYDETPKPPGTTELE